LKEDFSMGTFIPKGTSTGQTGVVSEIAVVRHLQLKQIVTATRTDTGRLKLFSWLVNNNGSITLTGNSGNLAGTGAASSIDIARGNKFVSAFRDGNGNLKLLGWNISDAGVITRTPGAGITAGTATNIKIVALTASVFITACRAGNGRLKLISWRLNADGSFNRIGDSEAPVVVSEVANEVSLVILRQIAGGDRQLIAAVRNSSTRIKVIAWKVTSQGVLSQSLGIGGLTGLADIPLKMVRAVKDVSFGRIVTSGRDPDGNLRLISWSVEGDGSAVTPLKITGPQAIPIADNALVCLPNGKIVSAVRITTANRLKLIGWKMDAAGNFAFTDQSEQQPGSVSRVALCQEVLGIEPMFATATRASNNNVKLTSWVPA
jgi:hypothetical protein